MRAPTFIPITGTLVHVTGNGIFDSGSYRHWHTNALGSAYRHEHANRYDDGDHWHPLADLRGGVRDAEGLLRDVDGRLV